MSTAVPGPSSESTAYKDWSSSHGFGTTLSVPQISETAVWSELDTLNRKHCSATDMSMGELSSYTDSTGFYPDSMHSSGPSMKDCANGRETKIPANTPTAVTATEDGFSRKNCQQAEISEKANIIC
jgi:hypothetical protein